MVNSTSANTTNTPDPKGGEKSGSQIFCDLCRETLEFVLNSAVRGDVLMMKITPERDRDTV